MTHGTITKTGNSYAIRVPKSYIVSNGLQLGDTVALDEPLDRQQAALQALVRRGRQKGAVAAIPDPVAWQRASRAADSPWDEMDENNDSARQ